MTECDKCGTSRYGSKYPWYSYYSPKGVATDILWKYCDSCKNEMIQLFGIDESFFGISENDEEEAGNSNEYYSILYEVRMKMRKMEK